MNAFIRWYRYLPEKTKGWISLFGAGLWACYLVVFLVLFCTNVDSFLDGWHTLTDQLKETLGFFKMINMQSFVWIFVLLLCAMFLSPVSPRLSLIVTMEFCGLLLFILQPIFCDRINAAVAEGIPMKEAVLVPLLMLSVFLFLLFTNGFAGLEGTRYNVESTSRLWPFVKRTLLSLFSASFRGIFLSCGFTIIILLVTIATGNNPIFTQILIVIAALIAIAFELENHKELHVTHKEKERQLAEAEAKAREQELLDRGFFRALFFLSESEDDQHLNTLEE